MNRAAFADFNTQRLAAQYETWGEAVVFPARGPLTVTGCASGAALTVIAIEGGDEIQIERSVRIRIADLATPPRRWELVSIGSGSYCIAGMTVDEHASEYLLQLANAALAAQFS